MRDGEALHMDSIQRGQGGLHKLFSVDQQRPLCSSGVSVPWKEQGCKALAVASRIFGQAPPARKIRRYPLSACGHSRRASLLPSARTRSKAASTSFAVGPTSQHWPDSLRRRKPIRRALAWFRHADGGEALRVGFLAA